MNTTQLDFQAAPLRPVPPEKNWPEFIERIYQRWPSEVVARLHFRSFSGGLVGERRMANLDSQGKGPCQKVTMGARRVAYTLESACDFLASRCKVEQRRGGDNDS